MKPMVPLDCEGKQEALCFPRKKCELKPCIAGTLMIPVLGGGAGRSGMQGYPHLHSKLYANLGYMKPSFKAWTYKLICELGINGRPQV